MNVKEYLGQAYRLDQRINSKLEQLQSLNDLATKASSTLTGMPRNPNNGTSIMAEAVTIIIDLQSEIDHDIIHLVNLKREIVGVIKAIDNTELQTLLELRYLCYKSWEQIAVDMSYNVRHVYRMHDQAVSMIAAPVASR